MEFKKGQIEGVTITPGRKWIDERGWLMETFRHDEMDQRYYPTMGYTSLTLPEVVRGPHEHVHQSDYFVFMGPGNFKVFLWDNRKDSPTFWTRHIFCAGEDYPVRLLVPPGVVHAYKNISNTTSIVHNFPNQLFMGKNKKEPIDEIRHEDDHNTVFKVF